MKLVLSIILIPNVIKDKTIVIYSLLFLFLTFVNLFKKLFNNITINIETLNIDKPRILLLPNKKITPIKIGKPVSNPPIKLINPIFIMDTSL